MSQVRENDQKRPLTVFEVTKYRLPRWELAIYLLLFIVPYSYALFDAFRISIYEARKFTGLTTSFKEGWSIFGGRPRDHSQMTWNVIYNSSTYVITCGLGHAVVISILTRLFKIRQNVRNVLTIAVGFGSCVYLINGRLAAYILAQQIFYFLATSLFPYITVAWLIGILFFTIGTFFWRAATIFVIVPIAGANVSYEQWLFFVFTQSMGIIRAISWAYEAVQKRHKGWDGTTGIGFEQRLLQYLTYQFYFPVLFIGPFVGPRRFVDQFLFTSNKPTKEWESSPLEWNQERILSLMYRSIRVIFYFYLIEIVLHFLYFNAWIHDEKSLAQLSSDWALTATANALPGILFQLEYIVAWGFHIALASLDGVTATECPRCVTRIIHIPELWRTFDASLYEFMRDYIYVPLGGSKANFAVRTISSLLCFIFVGSWHGLRSEIIVWILLNFLVVTIDSCGPQLLATKPCFSRLQKIPMAWQRRLWGVSILIPYYLNTISIIYFFSIGYKALVIYIDRLFVKNWFVGLTTTLAYYSLIQLSIEADVRNCHQTSPKTHTD